MDYFLIDYENTGESGLKGIRELGEDTCTVIFYSENADKISFEMHQTLCCCRTKLEFRKVYTGKKNALDFQLSTYLGFLIATNPENHFFIVSKDNGYRVVMEFWKDKKIRQIDAISRAHAKPLMIETRKQQIPSEADTGMLAGEPGQELSVAMNAPQAPAAGRSLDIPETPTGEIPVPEPEAGTGQKAESQEQRVKNPEERAEGPEQKTENPEQKTENPEQKTENLVQRVQNFDQNGKNQENPEVKSDITENRETPEEKKENPEKRPHRGGRRRKTASQVPPVDEFQPSQELKAAIAEVIEGKEEQEHIGRFIVKYKTKQGVNNAIVKLYGTEKAGELYKKIKPLLKDKKGK